IYLLTSQPPRMTELIGLRHTNTAYGSLRNVFIQHRIVCLLFSYHKGYQLSGRTKVIYRYLPRELGNV
ncbi:zinc knuckle, partial [Cladorrhinum sp. PSN259]